MSNPVVVEYPTFGLREIIVETPDQAHVAILCDNEGVRIKVCHGDFWFVSDPISWADIGKPPVIRC